MATTTVLPEQRILLHNVAWETYERLLADRVDSPGTRFAYDDRDLEIMVVSFGHEEPTDDLRQLVEVVADAMGRDVRSAGSATFKRKDLAKGIEPDCCFYFENAQLLRGMKEIDLTTDPAPELIVEVDITSSSLNRFRIFAALGVREVWRYHDERVRMYRLERDHYNEIPVSQVLPPLTARQATIFVHDGQCLARPEWNRGIREWVAANR